MTWLVTEKRRVFTRSLRTVLEVHGVFDFRKCNCMDQDLDSYRDEIVQ